MMEPPHIEIRDEDLEPVRRYMTGDLEGLEVFARHISEPGVAAGRCMFVAASAVAVRRRFARPPTRREISDFIADTRITMDLTTEDLDPRVAEDWIRGVLGEESMADRIREVDPEILLLVTINLLNRLRVLNITGEDGLEPFLHEALDLARRTRLIQDPLPPTEVLFNP